MSGGLGIDEIHLLDTHQRIVDNTADRGCVLITAARAELDVRIRLGEVLGSIVGRDERLAAFERAAFGGDKRELAEVAVAQTVVERGGDVYRRCFLSFFLSHQLWQQPHRSCCSKTLLS